MSSLSTSSADQGQALTTGIKRDSGEVISHILLPQSQAGEAPLPPSGTCSWGGGVGTGKGGPEKLRNLPEITQQIN